MAGAQADAGAGKPHKKLESEFDMAQDRPGRTLGANIRIAATISAYLLLNSSLVRVSKRTSVVRTATRVLEPTLHRHVALHCIVPSPPSPAR